MDMRVSREVVILCFSGRRMLFSLKSLCFGQERVSVGRNHVGGTCTYAWE